MVNNLGIRLVEASSQVSLSQSQTHSIGNTLSKRPYTQPTHKSNPLAVAKYLCEFNQSNVETHLSVQPNICPDNLQQVKTMNSAHTPNP
jgi:hypothetical protein